MTPYRRHSLPPCPKGEMCIEFIPHNYFIPFQRIVTGVPCSDKLNSYFYILDYHNTSWPHWPFYMNIRSNSSIVSLIFPTLSVILYFLVLHSVFTDCRIVKLYQMIFWNVTINTMYVYQVTVNMNKRLKYDKYVGKSNYHTITTIPIIFLRIQIIILIYRIST
jgi:hypothetical protein